MLRELNLRNVGPSPTLTAEFGPRLNLVTGDNGLGKSFLLDVAWWALSRQWPRDLNPRLTSGYPARPRDPSETATIGFTLAAASGAFTDTRRYDADAQRWSNPRGRPHRPGLVIYAHAEGGFSVYDPARNYWKDREGEADGWPRGYSFTQAEVWDGLRQGAGDHSRVVCLGLLADWANWINKDGEDAALMRRVLELLSPEGEAYEVGPLLRLSLDDARDIPSFNTQYGKAIPSVHASAGMRRILGLCYMIAWSWREHKIAARERNQPHASQLLLLVDEIEAHLHPLWQRTILKSIMGLAEIFQTAFSLQSIIVTHSPIVMAAAEPLFDHDTDRWLDFDLNAEAGQVSLLARDFIRQGTAGRWLTTEAFHLGSEGRSLEAEAVIAEANELVDAAMQGHVAGEEVLGVIEAKIAAVLPEFDEFRVRWDAWRQARAGS